MIWGILCEQRILWWRNVMFNQWVVRWIELLIEKKLIASRWNYRMALKNKRDIQWSLFLNFGILLFYVVKWYEVEKSKVKVILNVLMLTRYSPVEPVQSACSSVETSKCSRHIRCQTHHQCSFFRTVHTHVYGHCWTDIVCEPHTHAPPKCNINQNISFSTHTHANTCNAHASSYVSMSHTEFFIVYIIIIIIQRIE